MEEEMTHLNAQATRIDTSKLLPSSFHESLLTKPGFYTGAPWQYVAVSRLREIEVQPAAVLPAGNLQVAGSTANFARAVVGSLPGLDLPVPVVCPVSGGSIGMIWSLGTKQLEAIFPPDGLGSFVLSHGDEVIDDGDIKSTAIDALRHALDDLMRA